MSQTLCGSQVLQVAFEVTLSPWGEGGKGRRLVGWRCEEEAMAEAAASLRVQV